MNEKHLDALRERTDAKLRYAEVHLNELVEIQVLGGNDFDRAHQESFLYHLIGTKDAFIQELNIYYGADLPESDLTVGKLRVFMKSQSKSYSELTTIFNLESDETSWLSQAVVMRDHSTHISNIPRAYHVGGEYHQQVHLKNPKTGVQIPLHFVELFLDWLSNMKTLINDLRKSASTNITE